MILRQACCQPVWQTWVKVFFSDCRVANQPSKGRSRVGELSISRLMMELDPSVCPCILATTQEITNLNLNEFCHAIVKIRRQAIFDGLLPPSVSPYHNNQPWTHHWEIC